MLVCVLRLPNSGYRDISSAGHFGSEMPDKWLSSENMLDCSSWDGLIPELMQVPHINPLLLPQQQRAVFPSRWWSSLNFSSSVMFS